MMVSNEGSIRGLLQWQRPRVVRFLGAASAIWLVHDVIGFKVFELPALPLSVVGAAIGIFASFRTNSAYDRWWEGRKLWGRLINTSRHWCSQVLHYIGPHDPELARVLVHRHIAYVHVLRALLRKEPPLKDLDVVAWMTDEEQVAHARSSNLTHALLDRQLDAVATLHREGHLDGHQLERLDVTLYDLLNIQGGCERIKGTPLPRGYGFIVETLIDYFGMLFPFALVHELGWICIPLNVLVGLSFSLISEAGRVLEDPFNTFWNALPLSALTRKIEINLRERLGETELPPELTPDANGILM